MMARLSREQFVERAIELVRTRFPLVKIARAAQPFALRVNGLVAPLENLYRMAMLQPEEMQHSIERWVVELLRASEGTPDDHAPFLEVRERILPVIIPAAMQDADSDLLVQPLVADLQIGYALDSDRTISYITSATQARWKVGLDEIHATALENLVARSESLAAHAAQDEDGRVNLILFQTLDGYDASRVLLPNLHARLREHLGSPFIAAVPNRDILLCFRDDPRTLQSITQQVKRDFRSMPHQVTDRLLLVTADGLAAMHG